MSAHHIDSCRPTPCRVSKAAAMLTHIVAIRLRCIMVRRVRLRFPYELFWFARSPVDVACDDRKSPRLNPLVVCAASSSISQHVANHRPFACIRDCPCTHLPHLARDAEIPATCGCGCGCSQLGCLRLPVIAARFASVVLLLRRCRILACHPCLRPRPHHAEGQSVISARHRVCSCQWMFASRVAIILCVRRFVHTVIPGCRRA
jgi:hypothetical protein